MTQIAILGWGAYLALDGELTGGMMIAASIIAGRALQPLEGMIEGWRSLRADARRLCARASRRSSLAARDAAPAPAQTARTPDRRRDPLPAARHEGAGPQRVSLRARSPANRWPSSVRPARASPRWRAFSSAACCRPRARSGSTAPSCATGTAGSSANTPATCRRRSSCFPGLDQGERLPHAQRSRRRRDLRARRCSPACTT